MISPRSNRNRIAMIVVMLVAFTFMTSPGSTQERLPADMVLINGKIVTVDKNNEFSPTFQISLYAKVNVNEHFRCFVGYDYLFVGQISRAFNIIDYNEDRTAANPAVGTRVRDDNSKFSADGITAGIELVW